MKPRIGLDVLAITSLIAISASASDSPAAPHFGPNDVTSAFHISKSENNNQVHYGVRLDAQCNLAGGQPVYAYWRMRDGSAPRVEGLLPREQRAYGIASQTVTGDTIRVTLRPIPTRPIYLRARRTDSGCRVTATTAIASRPGAHLDNVFVQLAWPFGVRYFELVGEDASGAPARERISR